MAHKNNHRDPRGNERFPAYTGDIEQQKTKETGKNLDELGKNIDPDKLMPRQAKDKIAEFLVKAKGEKLKSQEELGNKYEALTYAVFSDFDDLITEDGELQSGAAGHPAGLYIKNFAIDNPNWDVVIGKYGDKGDMTIYKRKKNT